MTITEIREQGGRAGGGTAIRSVSFVVFDLRFAEPGGVTVPGTGDQPQALLDRGPDGRVQLPGTSLAGALRELVGGQRASEWFGPVLEEGVEPRASRIWVLGSRRVDDAPGEVLASTKIDRARGAARDNTLRKEEVLPAGARFRVFLRWDDASPSEVGELTGLLAAWRPLIGRGVSRGRGRCVAEDVRHGTLRLAEPDDLLRWLTLSGPDLVTAVATEQVLPGPSVPDADADVLFRVPVSIAGPWRIGTGEKSPKGSREPMPLRRMGGKPVVPGSSVKGLLRSRAEFILRSVGVTPVPCDDASCGSVRPCWTCRVFGQGGGQDPGASSVGVRAAVRIADAVVADPVEAERTHIAIDRFTGGVLNGALYTTQVLEGGTFPVAVERLTADDDLAREVRAVLRLVLEDLDDGLTGMGGGTTRGYGSVTVDFAAAAGLPSADEARNVLADMVRRSGNDGS